MHRPQASSITVLFAAISIAGLVVAAVAGTAGGLLVGLSLAAIAALIAAVAWRQAAALATPLSTHWWKYLAGGGTTLAVLVAVTVHTGELPSTGTWYLVMGVGLMAVGALAAGLVLAVVELDRRRRHLS